MAGPLYDPSIRPRVVAALAFLKPMMSPGRFEYVVDTTEGHIGNSTDYEDTVDIIKRFYYQDMPHYGLNTAQINRAFTAVVDSFLHGFPPLTPLVVRLKEQQRLEAERRLREKLRHHQLREDEIRGNRLRQWLRERLLLEGRLGRQWLPQWLEHERARKEWLKQERIREDRRQEMLAQGLAYEYEESDYGPDGIVLTAPFQPIYDESLSEEDIDDIENAIDDAIEGIPVDYEDSDYTPEEIRAVRSLSRTYRRRRSEDDIDDTFRSIADDYVAPTEIMVVRSPSRTYSRSRSEDDIDDILQDL